MCSAAELDVARGAISIRGAVWLASTTLAESMRAGLVIKGRKAPGGTLASLNEAKKATTDRGKNKAKGG